MGDVEMANIPSTHDQSVSVHFVAKCRLRACEQAFHGVKKSGNQKS